MDELPTRLQGLRDHISDCWDQGQVEPALVALRQTVRRRRRRRVAGTAAVVALVAATVVYATSTWRVRQGRPAELAARPAVDLDAREVSRSPVASAAPQTGRSAVASHMVALPDGSRYRALAQHSRLDIRQVSIERIHLALEAGAARFEVSKRAERAFHVSAGSVEVVVLGTTFMVEREPARTAKRAQRVRVAVEQGRVRVRWRAGEVLLGAGDSRWFVDVPAAEPVAAVARGKGAPAARLSARKRRRQAGGPTPTWRQLAGRGMYAEAYELLSVAGPGTSAEVRDEPSDLFLAADSARLARQPRRALPYLRRIIERYPQDERAPLAAFTLGRLYLQLRQPASSAAAFAQTRELDDHGPLAEDALAREVQAWSEADRPKLARERATRYLQRYPEGRHRAAVRRWGGVE